MKHYTAKPTRRPLSGDCRLVSVSVVGRVLTNDGDFQETFRRSSVVLVRERRSLLSNRHTNLTLIQTSRLYYGG